MVRPEDIDIAWGNLTVRIVIIAPNLPPRVLRLANKINYPVDLLEIKRFSIEGDEFILINQLEPEPGPKIGITRGQEVYDRDFYLKNCNKASVPKFFETIEHVDKVVRDKNWKLEKKMNKYYVTYKYGFPQVFGVSWMGSRSFGLFFKLPKEKARSIVIPGITFHRYEEEWKQAFYKVENPDRDVDQLLPLFEAAFKYVTGIEEDG